MRLLLVILSIFCLFKLYQAQLIQEEHWTGRWFPDHTTESAISNDHRVPMGILNPECDDAETRLEIDWTGDSINHTCFDIRIKFVPDYNVRPLYEVESIPPIYKAAHACMNESISYDDVIPTFGTHRPLWPQWGEYKFVPKQRWLHNLEHGGIVMLYHPCANKIEINKLKRLVQNCLYRHIITPYNLLKPKMPLALVAWGKRLQMSAVSPKVVIQFIKEAALRGAEHTPKDGQYKLGLINHANVISNIADDILCPNY